MIRSILLLLVAGIALWAPWMDTNGARAVAAKALAAFGPVPSVCYDGDGKVLQDGLIVRWYPMGRLVHTCSGDYVVWMWNSVMELGGVYKHAEDIRAVQTKALTCDEVLRRQQARRSTSSIAVPSPYMGAPATNVDYSLFPGAETFRTAIAEALAGGATYVGKFAVATWGCGSNCQRHAIVDVETGRVIAFGIPTEYGVAYSLDSNILVTNPVQNLPKLSETDVYDAETMALSIARLPRDYYELTTDALSDTQYLVRQCIESSAAGYVKVEDDRLGLVHDKATQTP